MDTRRVKFFFKFAVFMFIVIIIRMIYLQNFVPSLKVRSEANKVRTITIEPSRGCIFDRNGNIIIDNQYSYNLYVIPEQFLRSGKTTDLISEVAGLEKDSILKELSSENVYPDRYYRLERDIDFKTFSIISENRSLLRGVLVKKEWTRNFIEQTAPHIIGYLGQARDLSELNENISYGDLIGKQGVEFVYDSLLRGVKGSRMELRDVKGRKISDYKKGEWTEAKKGKDIYLTIDLRLQKYIESMMEGRSGAVIVQNCNNGEILSLVSKPDFPLSIFSRKLSHREWDKWNKDPAKPLLNKGVMGLYPPGSVIKMATAASAYDQGIKDIEDKVNCPGGMQIGNRFIRCWNRTGHGDVNMLQALMMSCDTYFYDIALSVDLNRWKETLNSFGMGYETGIDQRYERSGLVPDVEYYRKRIKGDLTGRYANLMMGQGEILTTPLQIANYTSMLANGGLRLTPHLFLKAGEEDDFSYYEMLDADTVSIAPELLDVLRKSMYHVVNTRGGTAHRAKSSVITFAGKTGTAQNPHGDDHAWFTAYAPYENPKITVTVFEEHGLHGSAAALVVKDIFEFWAENIR